MKIFLKAGARGWIETQVNGLTLIRFAEDTTIEVEHCRRHWYRTKGQVANLPHGHPPIDQRNSFVQGDGLGANVSI